MACPLPLLRFENIIVRPDQNATKTETATDKTNPVIILKMINLSMRSRCMLQDLARTLERWRVVLPSYSIFVRDDDAVDRLMDLDWLDFPTITMP